MENPLFARGSCIMLRSERLTSVLEDVCYGTRWWYCWCGEHSLLDLEHSGSPYLMPHLPCGYVHHRIQRVSGARLMCVRLLLGLYRANIQWHCERVLRSDRYRWYESLWRWRDRVRRWSSSARWTWGRRSRRVRALPNRVPHLWVTWYCFRKWGGIQTWWRG